MPLIEVTLSEGRDPDKLRSLITALTDAVVDTGVGPRESVRVILREVPATHFAAGGETLAERAERRARDTAAGEPHQHPNQPEHQNSEGQ